MDKKILLKNKKYGTPEEQDTKLVWYVQVQFYRRVFSKNDIISYFKEEKQIVEV